MNDTNKSNQRVLFYRLIGMSQALFKLCSSADLQGHRIFMKVHCSEDHLRKKFKNFHGSLYYLTSWTNLHGQKS